MSAISSGESSLPRAPGNRFSRVPGRRWLMSQFWQKTQRRLQKLKKIVPDPL